jgi:hypothetical protein
MHNSMKFFFCFIVISSMLCSCYSPRYVYSPSTQNIPLLNKKNDLEFSAFYAGSLNAFKGKGNYNRGFDIQSAWAVSNHFALMVNESARWEKNGANDTFFYSDSSSLSYKRNFTEFGAGYFSLMHHNAKMKIQLFGGVAFGGSKITDDYFSNGIQTDKYHNSKVTKIFIQPALIYSPTKKFSGALTSRFTEVIFAHINTNYTLNELDNYILDSLNTSPVYFWEPAVSYTFGFKKVPVKIRVQGSITILINHRFVEHRTGNLALGVIADISQKKIKEPASKN